MSDSRLSKKNIFSGINIKEIFNSYTEKEAIEGERDKLLKSIPDLEKLYSNILELQGRLKSGADTFPSDICGAVYDYFNAVDKFDDNLLSYLENVIIENDLHGYSELYAKTDLMEAILVKHGFYQCKSKKEFLLLTGKVIDEEINKKQLDFHKDISALLTNVDTKISMLAAHKIASESAGFLQEMRKFKA